MKKRMIAVLLAASLLAGCGMSEDDKTKLEELRSRVTTVDSEISSMYGKVEDMHSTAQIDEDTYTRFTELDGRSDKLMEEGAKTKDVSDFEAKVIALENDLKSYKTDLEKVNSGNSTSLAAELVEVSLACEEQDKLMKRAVESGKITQEKYDEFLELKEKVDRYSIDNNLKYDDKFKESFSEIRQKLTALASEAGADNALIDRLIGSNDAAENGESGPDTAAAAEQDEETAEKSEIEPEKEPETQPQVQPLPENVSVLIDNYLDLQNFALEKQKSGELTDLDLTNLLKLGVELTYLKEAVEKDGVTENNTYTANDIKARLYDKAVELGYDKAEVFK